MRGRREYKLMGKDFFIADLHFGDSGIISYENRPFASAEEMEAELIKRWNNTVTEEDRIFVLGDFSFCDEAKNEAILKNLKGHKLLIMGNHDRHFDCDAWRRQGFEECIAFPVLYRDFYILSHEPVYLNVNMPYANLYGHVHNNPSYRTVSRQSFCLSAERIAYTPIPFEEICRRISELS